MEAFLLEPEPINHETILDSPRPVRIPKSKNKEYFREYYHTNVKQYFNCPHCSSIVQGNISKLHKHQKTEKCVRVRELIEKFSKMSLNN